MRSVHASPHAQATLDNAGIATLQLANAGRLNIVGSAAIAELRAALQALAAEPALRVLVLRGSGQRAFIGGADIAEMVALTPATAEAFITRLAGLCDAVMQMPVPVIARIPGWCLGGGLEVALACDLRLADDSAMFGMPDLELGHAVGDPCGAAAAAAGPSARRLAAAELRKDRCGAR